MRIGTIHAKAGNRTIDKRRIDSFQRRVIKPIFCQPAHLEIFHKDIGFCCQPPQDGAALGRGDIDGK